MGKPRLIIIIRHAQSEGNRDKTIHQNTPDHRVGLTEEGHQQARAAGSKLRALLREEDTLHFFISPYKRTRQTTEGILETLCSNDPTHSPFQRQSIRVYEEPRLREQDFGNFQPGTEEVERLWKERADYGHFFYRIPNGESGADVYDRVSSFNGSLWRRFKEDQMASVAVLVTHGLCSRVFLMAWYHYSVEFFEDLRNINHCEFLVMKLGSNGRYMLQNELRTWSALRRERLARRSISQAATSPPLSIPAYRWERATATDEMRTGEIQLRKAPQRQNTADLFKDDEPIRPQVRLQGQDQADGKSDPSYLKGLTTQTANGGNARTHPSDPTTPTRSLNNLTMGGKKEELNSPTQTFKDVAYFGRDGGGSRSGATSPFEISDEDNTGNKTTEPTAVNSKPLGSLAKALRGEFEDPNLTLGMPGSGMADALGDRSDADVEEDDKLMGTKAKEKKETERILEDELAERRAKTHAGDVY